MGALGVSQASLSPACPDVPSPSFHLLIGAMKIITLPCRAIIRFREKLVCKVPGTHTV